MTTPVHVKCQGPGTVQVRVMYQPHRTPTDTKDPDPYPIEQHFLSPGQMREFVTTKYQYVVATEIRPGP